MRLLHPKQVLRALYCGQRWRLKRLLRIPDRPRNPVVDGDSEAAFERHLRICTLLNTGVKALPEDVRTGVACEIGCGDCLSTADLFLGAGFRKVYLVEKQQIVLDDRQRALLKRLADLSELPNSLTCLSGDSPPKIDARIQIIPEFFENAELPEKVDLIFSNDVIEHVEDLPGFFSACARILKPGGVMLHKFDLSGHEFFEDPLPPLDFQTYPNWLYDLMFPKYRRACRWFLDEIESAIDSAAFSKPKLQFIRTAEEEYVKQLIPFLRADAKRRTVKELKPLDIVLTASLSA